ncbi:MAG: hypothetical protein U0930_01660 [Pirellulales bacterium]
MSISSLDLWQRIAAEGIASPMQCRSWAAEVAKSLPAADTADGLKVLQKLIDIGKLTKYQAKSLAGQSNDPLKRGSWNVIGRVKVPQWQGWLEVTKIDNSKGEQPPARWARWLKAEDLDGLRASAPSLPRGIQLAQIRHAHLQCVEMPEMVEGELQLRVEPVQGTSIAELFKGVRPSPEQVQTIVEHVTQALATMHQKQVVHGRVMPDRIFWDAAAGSTLVCDPISVWTASVEPSTGGVLGEHLNGLQLASFLAPEFLAPRQPPSMTSDIYALGATWWWLLTGKPPVEGKNVASTLGQAAEAVLDFTAQLADLPEPIRVCLQHCLAKNPAARFPNATGLLAAIEAAKIAVARGKVTLPRKSTIVAPVVVEASEAEPIAKSTVNTVVKSNIEPLVVAQATATEPNTNPPNVMATEVIASEKATQASMQMPTQQSTQPPAKTVVSSPTSKPSSSKLAPEKATTAQRSSESPTELQPTEKPVEKQVVKPTAKQVAQQVDLQVAQKKASERQPVAKDATSKATVSPKPATSKPPEVILVGDSSIALDSSANSASAPDNVPQLVEPMVAVEVSQATQGETQATETNTAFAAKITTASTSPIIARSGNNTGKTTVRRKAKRKSKLPLFVIAGFGFLAVVLGILKLSGALDSLGKKELADNKGSFQAPINTAQPTIIAKDPILEHFRLVDSKDAVWAPPQAPDPIPLDLFPPGAQLFIAIRPAQLLSGKTSALTNTLSKQFGFESLLKQIAEPTGQPIESIATLTVAFYNAPAPEQFPLYVVRVELSTGVALQDLKSSWKSTGEAIVGKERLQLAEKDLAYYVPQEEDASHVKRFSFGPVAVMKEAAELEGGTAAINTQFKQLHLRTCKQYQLVFFGSPRYLFNEGRGLVKLLPKRLQNQIEPIFGIDSRGGILQTNIGDQWYWELQLLGPTDAESPRITSRLNDSASTAATKIEQWLVEQTPHPYWRALALRFPQMIRTWREYSRFSLEDGVAIANGYLPSDAASNLVVATWVAAQESSTFAGQLASNTPASNSNKPAISPEEILNKPIRLIFDQEPIERALALIGEEANSDVPPESQLRFELDGGAFEKAGITRNQQMRDFKNDGKPVRDALTNVAKRGNPVTTVKDTRELDQRLIWVVKDDPKNPGKKMISLTTRDAATAENIPLSKEFAP